MQLPAAFLQSLQGLSGYDAGAFAAVHEAAEAPVSIRFNPQKPVPVPAGATPVPWCQQGYYLPQRPSFTLDPLLHAGAYYVQEASSMFVDEAVRQLLPADTPLRVLDLCAAPGGKSTLLRAALPANSLLVANEVIQTRVPILQENLIKWGATNTVVTHNDSRSFAQLPGFFDVLLVDAPCSGSGLFRRDVDAINEWSEANVALCAARQQRILADAWPALSEGGVLLYATCSFSYAEDEAIINWLTSELGATGIALQVPASWGVVQTEVAGAYGYRFWPHRLAGEGFFIAAFRKEGPVEGRLPKIKTAIPLRKPERQELERWVYNAAQYAWLYQGNRVACVTPRWEQEVQLLLQTLRVRYVGVEAGTMVRDTLVPDHALALSLLTHPQVPVIALSLEQALQYLRRQEPYVPHAPKGWFLVTYQGYPLGWMKGLGNRINNYYPKEWRIRMQ